MSAWIVNRKHIDVLVAGVLEQGGFRHHSKYITVVSDGFEYMGKNECMEAS